MLDLLKISLDGLSFLFQVSYYTEVLLAAVLLNMLIYIIQFIRGY